MQAILTRGLFPNGLSKERAVSLTASIVVNLAMVVAFASIANIDGEKLEKGAPLVVVGLSGSASESDQAEAKQAASLPAPPPPAAVPSSATPDFAKHEKPLEQKMSLLQPIEAPAEHADGAPSKTPAESQPSPDQLREAAEQQRRAQEAARARAAEQAEAEARAAATQNATARGGGARSGGAGGYGAQIIQHLRRFTRGNSVGAGATLVRISIDGSGGLQEAGVIRSSGSASFDREALQTVRRAAPFPKPPGGSGRTISFEFTGR